MTKEQQFWEALQNLFIGVPVEGRSGYINLMQVKSQYFRDRMLPQLQQHIDSALQPFPEFREELFDKLYAFFQRYFTDSGSIYFHRTPLHQQVYERVYTDHRDVLLFWKTHMLYYVKSDVLFRNMTVTVNGHTFFFDVERLEHKKANEKRALVYHFRERRTDGVLVFDVRYSERGRKTGLPTLISSLREAGVAMDEATLERAFRLFERQAEVDFFINKNARAFLREQLDLWLYQYMFRHPADWDARRVQQIQVLKSIAHRIIDWIAQFEDELVKIWNKPRFVLNSHYVITLDRLAERSVELLNRILTHSGMAAQLTEWRELGLVPPDFRIVPNGSGSSANTLAVPLRSAEALPERFRHLPVDTRHFPDIESDIPALFEPLDDALDGWLIKSENYQALNTLLPKFRRRVQTIYIDPPFNLGTNADFLYSVKYKDATWLTLLENRLRLAKELLHDAGSLFVRCDYNGNMYVRLLLNQLFGEERYCNEILINRKRQSIGTPTKFEVESEYLYWYAAGDRPYYQVLERPRSLVDFRWLGFLKQEERNPPERIFFGKVLYPPRGQHFSLVQPKVDKLLREHFLRLKCRGCGAVYYWDDRERGAAFGAAIQQERKNRFKYLDITPESLVFGVTRLDTCLHCGADDWKVEYLPAERKKITDNWKDIPSYESTAGFRTQNSEILLARVIEATSQPGQLVLDFFLGSGTTIAAAHKLGRKWIGIEMGAHFDTVVLPRMKKVLSGEPSGISKQVGWQGGGFFKYFELEQYEDILRRVRYRETTPGADTPSGGDSLFTADLKLLHAVELDPESDAVQPHFERLYPNIDLAETLSCLLGKSIRRQTATHVEFSDGERIDLRRPAWAIIQPLIWWR